MIDWAGLVTSANMTLPCSYCERLKARGNYSSYFSRGHAALLYEYMIMASSWVNKGTREAILTLRLILEDRLRKGKPTFLAFVDWEKAFDSVDWNTLFQILKVAGVKYRERRVILNLYKNQTAVIRVEEHERDAEVGKGVRQGCSSSSLLFNLYIEEAVKEWKEKFGEGIKVQWEEIKTLRFADDIVILSETAKDLEEQLNGLSSVLKGRCKMNINKSKTRIMECCVSYGKKSVSEEVKLFDIQYYFKC